MLTEEQFSVLMGWADIHIELGKFQGRTLYPDELEAAKKVLVMQPSDVRVVEVTSMPVVPTSLKELAKEHLDLNFAAGFTLGHVIFVDKKFYSLRLIQHELRHVKQCEDYGSVRAFLRDYVNQVISVGYENSPLEADAREHESL